MIFFTVTIIAFLVLTCIRFFAWTIHRVFTSEPVVIQFGFSESAPSNDAADIGREASNVASRQPKFKRHIPQYLTVIK